MHRKHYFIILHHFADLPRNRTSTYASPALNSKDPIFLPSVAFREYMHIEAYTHICTMHNIYVYFRKFEVPPKFLDDPLF